MTEGAMVVTWGSAVRGREHQSLEVFGEVLAWFRDRQEAGDVEGFEPIALEPSGGTLSGVMVVRGDPEKLARLRMREDWLRLVNRALHVVDDFGVHTGFRGAALDRLYSDWVAQSATLARTTPAYGSATFSP